MSTMFLALVATLFFSTQSFAYSDETLDSKTVEGRVQETQSDFDQRLAPSLKAAGLSKTPNFVSLLFFKDTKILSLYAGNDKKDMRFVKNYAVRAASGKPGPKLIEGDRQVPEGLYSIVFLNPNSLYHLSMRVDYPNQFDRAQAKRDGRKNLGGGIMVHGSKYSIGCIALGNDAISEVFHLAATTTLANWQILSMATDLRTNQAPADVVAALPWMAGVYDDLKTDLQNYPLSTQATTNPWICPVTLDEMKAQALMAETSLFKEIQTDVPKDVTLPDQTEFRRIINTLSLECSGNCVYARYYKTERFAEHICDTNVKCKVLIEYDCYSRKPEVTWEAKKIKKD
jgi:hypothetical protein